MKKTKLILIILVLLLNISITAKDKISKLKIEFSNSTDKKKSEILNKMFKIYLKKKKLALAIKISNKALDYAEKFNQDENRIDTFLNMGDYYICKDDLKKAEFYFNRALKNAKKINIDRCLIKVLDKQFIFYATKKKDMQYAIVVSQSLLKLYKKKKKLSKMAYYTHGLGSLYYLIGDIKIALKYLEKALVLYEKLGNKTRVVQILTYLGSRNQLLGNNKKGLFYLQKAEKKVKEIKPIGLIHLRIYANYKTYFDRVKKYRKALDYINMGIKIAKKLGEEYRFEVMKLYSYKSGILIKQGNYKLANDYLEKSISYKRTNEKWLKKDFVPEYKLYKCIITLKKKQYKKALKLFLDVLPLQKKEFGDTGVARIYKNFGMAYIGLKNFDKAKEYLIKSLNIYKKHKNVYILKEIYVLLSNVYNKKGEKKKSIKYLNLIENLNINF